MKKHLIIGISLVVLAALIVVGIVVLKKKAQPQVLVEEPALVVTETPTTKPTDSAPVVPKPVPEVVNAKISITSAGFAPTEVTIKAGQKVMWTNNDTVTHKVTADTLGYAGTKTLEPGQSYTFTFKKAGPFAYHDDLYPQMKGLVNITN